MGLSVSVVTNLKASDQEESYFMAYVIDDRWLHKIKNLIDGEWYSGDCVATCAGYAYSTHSRFREYLVALSGTKGILDQHGQIIWSKLRPGMPFYDLIDFADNEGCFDWETAENILKDFDKYAKDNDNSANAYMVSLYKDWHKALKVAVEQKGVVVFH